MVAIDKIDINQLFFLKDGFEGETNCWEIGWRAIQAWWAAASKPGIFYNIMHFQYSVFQPKNPNLTSTIPNTKIKYFWKIHPTKWKKITVFGFLFNLITVWWVWDIPEIALNWILRFKTPPFNILKQIFETQNWPSIKK